MRKLKAGVFAVEDKNEGLDALASAARKELNAYLTTNSVRAGEISAFSMQQVTDAAGKTGLLVSVIHTDVDAFSR